MKTTTLLKVVLLAAALVVTSASLASAQRLEVGASLASALFSLEEDNFSAIGIPTGGFGVANPGVYASIFLGSRVAVEPQLGLVVMSSDGESNHFVNFGGQIDYFVSGISRRSLYLLGAAGLVEISGGRTTPKWVGGGAGYRIPVGDRLTCRIDGRLTHYTENSNEVLAFAVSLGGLFG